MMISIHDDHDHDKRGCQFVERCKRRVNKTKEQNKTKQTLCNHDERGCQFVERCKHRVNKTKQE